MLDRLEVVEEGDDGASAEYDEAAVAVEPMQTQQSWAAKQA